MGSQEIGITSGYLNNPYYYYNNASSAANTTAAQQQHHNQYTEPHQQSNHRAYYYSHHRYYPEHRFDGNFLNNSRDEQSELQQQQQQQQHHHHLQQQYYNNFNNLQWSQFCNQMQANYQSQAAPESTTTSSSPSTLQAPSANTSNYVFDDNSRLSNSLVVADPKTTKQEESVECETPALRALLSNKELKYEPSYIEGTKSPMVDRKVPDFANSPPLSPSGDGLTINADSLLTHDHDWSSLMSGNGMHQSVFF